MIKKLLEIIGITYSHSQSGAYALILGEKGSKTRLPIIIGSAEAQSIAVAMDNIENRRPLTHDLFKTFADSYNITLTEVIINNFREGIFYSTLVTKSDNNEVRIDARTSDAIALAIRFKCPIYTVPQVLEEAGIDIDDLDLEEDNEIEEDMISSDGEYHTLSIEELRNLLEEAIENEDFESASLIRDEIKNRK